MTCPFIVIVAVVARKMFSSFVIENKNHRI